ncbi:M23 family metallopeptidase [Brachybacterium rhamnosum]
MLRRLLVVVVLVALTLLALPEPGAGAEGSGRWRWPAAPPHPVLRAFESPEHRYGSGHRGIDVGVPAGAEVHAVEAGTVHFAGRVAGRGVVSVRHADGLLSTYEPVAATVSAGDAVGAGSTLGTIEAVDGALSHCAPSTCLHLGARRGEEYLDPLLLLGMRGPSVLVRWDGGGSGGAGAGPAPLLSGDALATAGPSSSRVAPVPGGSSVRAGGRAATAD